MLTETNEEITEIASRIYPGTDLFAFMACATIHCGPEEPGRYNGVTNLNLRTDAPTFLDPDRQVDFLPGFGARQSYFMQVRTKYPDLVSRARRPGGNGGRHTDFYFLTYKGLRVSCAMFDTIWRNPVLIHVRPLCGTPLSVLRTEHPDNVNFMDLSNLSDDDEDAPVPADDSVAVVLDLTMSSDDESDFW